MISYTEIPNRTVSRHGAAVATSDILYGQCWEDADVLMAGLGVRRDDTCLSIASAGDNTLALLTARPAHVLAVDVNPAQLACLDLRAAAYRVLDHRAILELIGAAYSDRRLHFYRACRRHLCRESAAFWDERPVLLNRGLISAGRFERYLTVFRKVVLPLIHRRRSLELLFTPMSQTERASFFDAEWDTPGWRAMVRLFFSRRLMAGRGREAGFFRYAQESVSQRILASVRHAFVDQDPSTNPYLRWMLTGSLGSVLPFALREEHAEAIFQNLDALELRRVSAEDYLASAHPHSIDRFNLSDIFEYVSASHYRAMLRRIAVAAREGAHLVYWNLLVSRSRPPDLTDVLEPMTALSRSLHERDRTFFYRNVVVERVKGGSS